MTKMRSGEGTQKDGKMMLRCTRFMCHFYSVQIVNEISSQLSANGYFFWRWLGGVVMQQRGFTLLKDNESVKHVVTAAGYGFGKRKTAKNTRKQHGIGTENWK